MQDSSGLSEVDVDERWFWFGVILGVANLVFILVLVVLLHVDLMLGLAFAVVGGLVTGLAVMLYALQRA